MNKTDGRTDGRTDGASSVPSRQLPRLAGDGVGVHRKVPRLTETVGVHSDETMRGDLKAPFPWFGGKSRAAHLVWSRFGDVANYVEPFAGSLAVLLARPHAPRIETVNDIDCYLANFWRALQADSAAVAHWADGPVNEADLHARHTWLVGQNEFRERMKVDPEYFDVRIAGWWVWGLCLWIGTGWCDAVNADKIPNLTSGFGEGTGIHRKLPHLSTEGTGSTESDLPRQTPHLSTVGAGIHASGIHAHGIHAYLALLANRLRRVRVVCGDYARVLTPAVTSGIGLTGVFLDPPYGGDSHVSDIYTHDDRDLSAEVRKWAIENGENQSMRIALCGYDGEHSQMPESWECVGWKARGGYGSQRKDGENINRKRERIWFSPGCLKPGLFSAFMDSERHPAVDTRTEPVDAVTKG